MPSCRRNSRCYIHGSLCMPYVIRVSHNEIPRSIDTARQESACGVKELGLGIDQGQACLRVMLTAQMRRGGGDNHFQRWPYMGGEDMSTMRCAVRFANHHMGMY